jgi:hypothetical protein
MMDNGYMLYWIMLFIGLITILSVIAYFVMRTISDVVDVLIRIADQLGKINLEITKLRRDLRQRK